eukprot:5101363-Amphidinium_carterae.4
MMQRSYIRFHPTTGYHRATQEIRQFYDGFEIYNSENRFNAQKPINEDETKHTTLQQLYFQSATTTHKTSSTQ